MNEDIAGLVLIMILAAIGLFWVASYEHEE